MKRLIISASLYAAVALVTFGRIAASWEGGTCHKGTITESPCGTADQIIGGLFGGALWPLYWSWELQESQP